MIHVLISSLVMASSIFIVEFSSVENIFLEIYKESSMVKCYNEEKYHLNDDYFFNNFQFPTGTARTGTSRTRSVSGSSPWTAVTRADVTQWGSCVPRWRVHRSSPRPRNHVSLCR